MVLGSSGSVAAWRSCGDGLASTASATEVTSSMTTDTSKVAVLTTAVDVVVEEAALWDSHALGRMMGNNGVSMT